MAWTRRGLAAAGASAGLLAMTAGCATLPAARSRPIVIAHRGASGERPEHTLAAYALAIQQGADFIEPDLVISRDGVLLCRHDTEIGATTDIAARPEFAARRTAKTVDGARLEGWFAEDFTLAELKTLRCRERIPQLRPANAAFDGQEAIPTFQEVIDLAKRAERAVGVYPELKHPTFLAAAGLDGVPLLVEQLKRNGLDARDAPVFVQCFEVAPLQRLRTLTRARLIQLVASAGAPFDQTAAGRPLTYRDMTSPAGLAGMAAYADGIGPEKSLILPRDAEGGSAPPTTLVTDAHAAGLQVHPWTFRSENVFLPRELRRGEPTDRTTKGDAAAEYAAVFALGVDGVFSDHPADAVAARNRLAA